MRVFRGQLHFNGTTTIVILQFVLDIRRSADINGISHCLQLFMLRNVAFRTIHRKRKMTNNENNFTLRVLCPFKKFPFLKSGCYDEFCNIKRRNVTNAFPCHGHLLIKSISHLYLELGR